MKILLLFMCFFSVFALTACGTKHLPSAKITRDDARVGGSLSFVYDSASRKVYIGGQEEVVQFSSEDESRNLDAGCRVGLKVTAPDEKLNLASAMLEMNGVNYSADEFLEQINGEKQRFFNIYPVFSKVDDKVMFSIMWQEGTKKQEYEIQIMEGTRFMDKEGNVS